MSGTRIVKYQSGEEIRRGDRVLFHGEPGEIEFVADKLIGDPAVDWNITENGPGVMILEPKYFGRAYIRDTEDDEDLVFISRSEGK
jgi:hypothetical protein